MLADVPPTHPRPFEDLRESGLLWLINRTVFHPRGFALGITIDTEGHATGWEIIGDGTEPWQFGEDETENFRRAETTLRPAGGKTP